MLAIRLVDVFWIIEPAFYNQHLQIHWMDFVTPLAVGGLWLALFFWQLKSRPLLPLRDPRLQGRREKRWRFKYGSRIPALTPSKRVTRSRTPRFGRSC